MDPKRGGCYTKDTRVLGSGVRRGEGEDGGVRRQP